MINCTEKVFFLTNTNVEIKMEWCKWYLFLREIESICSHPYIAIQDPHITCFCMYDIGWGALSFDESNFRDLGLVRERFSPILWSVISTPFKICHLYFYHYIFSHPRPRPNDREVVTYTHKADHFVKTAENFITVCITTEQIETTGATWKSGNPLLSIKKIVRYLLFSDWL